MRWLKRKIRNWLNEEDKIYPTKEIVQSNSSPSQNGMNFTLYKAVGGHILETRVYNKRTDTHEGTLYMIHEDEDFAKQVAQAIMLESLKQ